MLPLLWHCTGPIQWKPGFIEVCWKYPKIWKWVNKQKIFDVHEEYAEPQIDITKVPYVHVPTKDTGVDWSAYVKGRIIACRVLKVQTNRK